MTKGIHLPVRQMFLKTESSQLWKDEVDSLEEMSSLLLQVFTGSVQGPLSEPLQGSAVCSAASKSALSKRNFYCDRNAL